MQIGDSVPFTIVRSGDALPNIKVEFTAPLPPQVANLTKLDIQVKQVLPNGAAEVLLPNGAKVAAKIEPMPELGSKLLLAVKGSGFEVKQLLPVISTDPKAAPQLAPQLKALINQNLPVTKLNGEIPPTINGRAQPVNLTAERFIKPQALQVLKAPVGDLSVNVKLPLPIPVGAQVKATLTPVATTPLNQQVQIKLLKVELPQLTLKPATAALVMGDKTLAPLLKIPVTLPTNVARPPLNVEIMATVNPSPQTGKVLIEVPKVGQFEVKLNPQLIEGAKVAIRFSNDGAMEVLRVVQPTHARDDRSGNNRQDGAASQGGKAINSNTPAPNNNAANIAATLKPGAQLTGTITAQGTGGHHTISLSSGQFIDVQAGKQMPLGTQLKIEITASGEAKVLQITVPPTTAQTTALGSVAERIPNLNNALNLLRSEHPQLADKINAAMPNGSNAMAAMLNWLEAASSKNPERVINQESLNILRALGVDLSGDISALHLVPPRAEGTPESNWRGLIFPFMEPADKDAKQGGFFWRRQHDENGKKQSTRFVLANNFSMLGEVQLDGLLSNENLIIKLRFKSAPPEFMQAEIAEIIGNFLTNMNLGGGATVETVQGFEVDPLGEMLQNLHRFNVTT